MLSIWAEGNITRHQIGMVNDTVLLFHSSLCCFHCLGFHSTYGTSQQTLTPLWFSSLLFWIVECQISICNYAFWAVLGHIVILCEFKKREEEDFYMTAWLLTKGADYDSLLTQQQSLLTCSHFHLATFKAWLTVTEITNVIRDKRRRG